MRSAVQARIAVCSVLAVCLALGGLGPAFGAATSSDRFTVARADRPFVLDPTLADPRWGPALRAEGFVDLATRGPARDASRAAVFYDDANLYIGFRLDQRVPITATQSTDDIGFGIDDFVGVGIDPIGNGERAYWFETTPCGVRYQQAAETARFLPQWSAAATTAAGGWSAMMIVPLRILRIPGSGPQHWRFDFERYVAATSERDSWAYNPLMPNTPIAQFPDFREARWWPTSEGIVLDGASAKPRPRAEVYVLSSSGSDRNVFTNAAGTTFDQNARHFGVDAIYPFQPTIALDLSLNADFSNVEIDQQTIAPQQFRRNLREYRPFFAQGANYINTEPEDFEFNFAPDQVFYSPSLGPFDRGLKIEGTKGTQSFGVLEAAGDDPTGPNNFDDIAFGFKHKRLDNTLAIWADGVIANHSAGADRTIEMGAYGRSLASGLVYAFNHASEFGSFVASPAQAQKNEGFVDIQKQGLEAAVGWIQIGPQYDPVDGFTNIADIRGPNGQIDYLYTPHVSKIWKNIEFYGYADRWLDSQGNVHESDVDGYLTFRTKKQVTFNLNYQNGTQRSYGGNYFSGYPNDYADAIAQPYVAPNVGFTIGDGAPKSFTANYQWGPFGGFYLNAVSTTVISQLGRRAAFEFDYAGTLERPLPAGPANGQWLRRLTLGIPLGAEGNASIGYRVISGTGGFATPGKNVAVALRKRFRGGNELFVDYGTPAANTTLDRMIVKYLVRVGGGV